MILAAGVLSASAQKAYPRIGVKANTDNTYRFLSQKFIGSTDATGADTVKVYPGTFSVYDNIALVDSITYQIKSNAGAYAGDNFFVQVTNGTGTHKVKFTNKGANSFLFGVSAGDSTISLTTGQRLYIRFIFDGVKWLETAKVVK